MRKERSTPRVADRISALIGAAVLLGIAWFAISLLSPTALQFSSGLQAPGIHGTACKATMSKFNMLFTGIAYQEAVGFTGCQGKEMSRSSLGSSTTIMYGWDGEGMVGANMNALFQNDRLVSKAQFGLR